MCRESDRDLPAHRLDQAGLPRHVHLQLPHQHVYLQRTFRFSMNHPRSSSRSARSSPSARTRRFPASFSCLRSGTRPRWSASTTTRSPAAWSRSWTSSSSSSRAISPSRRGSPRPPLRASAPRSRRASCRRCSGRS